MLLIVSTSVASVYLDGGYIDCSGCCLSFSPVNTYTKFAVSSQVNSSHDSISFIKCWMLERCLIVLTSIGWDQKPELNRAEACRVLFVACTVKL